MFQVRKVKNRVEKKEGGKLPRSRKGWDSEVWEEKGMSEELEVKGGDGGSRREERLLELREEEGESLLPSIFTGSELLKRELELERVPKTLQIQLHLETQNEETEREIT